MDPKYSSYMADTSRIDSSDCSRTARRAAMPDTCGADGSVCRCAGRTITTPAFAVDVVDTTGAGDTFRAGLAAGLVHLGPAPTPDDVLGMANAAAALNCRAPGAQAGLPTLDEVTGLLAQRRPSR